MNQVSLTLVLRLLELEIASLDDIRPLNNFPVRNLQVINHDARVAYLVLCHTSGKDSLNSQNTSLVTTDVEKS